jgi:IS30 family transposase
MISQRTPEAADRAVPRHWEGDLILGVGSSAIGTLVVRTTRFTLLLHLPRMSDCGRNARVKNGPALAEHGAEAVRDAITWMIITLSAQLRRSLTWDAEMVQHARLKVDKGVQVYFCDPQALGSAPPTRTRTACCANTSPRAPIPVSAEQIAAISAALNARPRKTLDWKTPAEALDHLLLSAEKDHVATIT